MTINNKHKPSVDPLKVFVINLTRRPDRLAEITAELTPLDIKEPLNKGVAVRV